MEVSIHWMKVAKAHQQDLMERDHLENLDKPIFQKVLLNHQFKRILSSNQLLLVSFEKQGIMVL
jgi:hypothetical protein